MTDHGYRYLKEGGRFYMVARQPAIFDGRTYGAGAALRTSHGRVRSWADEDRAYRWKDTHIGPTNKAWVVTSTPSVYAN